MTGWIIETLAAATLLMLVVLALREPVAQRFGPQAAYLLWLLPAMRMVLPPLPAGWFAFGAAPVAQVSIIMGKAVPATAPSALGWPLVIAAFWCVGALGFIGWQIIIYHRFSARLRRSAERLAEEGAVSIRSSAAVRAPLAFGVVDPVIILPADFKERYDGREQHFALAHEMSHHRRGDLIANIAGLIVLAIHWFNPVAHIAWRAFRLDQEAACDALVLAGASVEDRQAYGTALFKSAMGGVPRAACTMTGASGLKMRLRRIVAGRVAPMRGGARAAGIIVVAGLALTVSTGIVADARRTFSPAKPDAALPQQIAQAVMPIAPAVRPAALATVAPKAEAQAQAQVKPATPPSRAEAPEAAIPPVAPQPDFLPVAAPLAPVAPVAAITCPEGTREMRMIRQIAMPDAPVQTLRISTCAPDARATRAMVMRSLAAARGTIAADPDIPADVRRKILEALDHRMADLPAAAPLS